MHVGFETTPVLGAKRQFGDTWKMLKWQFSGHMGGNPDEVRQWWQHERRPGFGWRARHADASPCRVARLGLLGRTDCGCYDHAGHRSDGFSRQPRRAPTGWARGTRPCAGASVEPERLRALDGTGAERVAGDLRDAASLDTRYAGVRRGLSRRRGLSTVGPRPAGDLRIECDRHAELAGGGAPGGRCQRFVYTSTVATIAVPRRRCSAGREHTHLARTR